MALIQFNSCSQCTLKKEWPNLTTPRMPVVLPEQKSPYRIVMIGEGPGAQEDDQGCPFVGQSGQVLRQAIPTEWRKKLYWTNIVRCRPPKNRTPTPLEQSCCSTYLQEDLVRIKPHAIFGIGDVALNYFWPKDSTASKAGITKLRGLPFPVQLKDGTWTWFMSTFHPSYVMRSSNRNYDGSISNPVEPVFSSDIRRFFNSVDSFLNTPKIPVPPKDILYPNSILEAQNLTERLISIPAVDYETFKLRPYMRDARLLAAGISDGSTTFSLPVNWMGDINPWGIEFLTWFFTKFPEWVAQSASMEFIWTISKVFNGDLRQALLQKFEDTEVLGRLLNKRKGLGNLEALGKLYLGVNPKELTKVGGKQVAEYSGYQGETRDKVLEYNGYDAWAEATVFNVLREKLPSEDEDNYRSTLETIKSTTAMELVGLEVDLDASAELKKVFKQKSYEIQTQGRQLTDVMRFEREQRKPFSITSPKIIADVMVNYCGIDLPKTESLNYTTDEKILTPFIGKHPLVLLVLDSREVEKILSTYIDPILTGQVLGVDRRLHAIYKVIHTATYRLSSELPNIQNWPKRKNKEIRRQVRAQKGFILVAFDYGQLEARVLAMASKCLGLFDALINIDKVDLHWKWLYRIIELYPQYMDRLAIKSGEKEEKKILDAGRTIIKTDFVFSSFYNSQPPAISNKTEIPLKIVEQVQSEFWQAYSGARKWIDSQFEFYQNNGYVQSLTGRIRDEVLPGNEIINTPIQGTASELVLEAQNALFNKALMEDIYLLPRINIHDDLVFEMPDDDDLEARIRIVGAEIVEPRFNFVTVPLVTEARVGYTWDSLEKITLFKGPYFKEAIGAGTN